MSRLRSSLKHKHAVAEGTVAFHFEKPTGFEFKPGQAIDLFLPAESAQTEAQSHAFSIVSAPHEPDLVIATRIRDSQYKRSLNAMEPGSNVEIDGPFGSLTLHKNAARASVLVAGGIGITPFMSMLRNAASQPSSRTLLLICSNRRPEDTAYLAELEDLQKRMPNFRMLATMTDMAHSSQDWKGSTGKVDGDFVRNAIADLENPIAYVSGPPGLVQAMRAVLADAGIDEEDIRSEEFFGY